MIGCCSSRTWMLTLQQNAAVTGQCQGALLVVSSKMPAKPLRCLINECPRVGVAVGLTRWGRNSLEHGTEDEPAQGGYEGDRAPASVGVLGRQAVILDELRQLTSWHRDHARKAFRRAL